MKIEQYITDEAKLFVLDQFIEQNQDTIKSLSQIKHTWHFFGRFMRLRPIMDEKECKRLAILAAHLHANYNIAKSKLMTRFCSDSLIDFTYELLESHGQFKSILDSAISVHAVVDKDGETKPITLQ